MAKEEKEPIDGLEVIARGWVGEVVIFTNCFGISCKGVLNFVRHGAYLIDAEDGGAFAGRLDQLATAVRCTKIAKASGAVVSLVRGH